MGAALNMEIASKWLDAFNKHSLEELLLLYDDHARHYSPKLKLRKPDTDGFISGKEALREWWADAFLRLPSLQYHINNIIASDEAVFMEYTRCVSGEENLRVGEVLEVSNGKIAFSRVYHG